MVKFFLLVPLVICPFNFLSPPHRHTSQSSSSLWHSRESCLFTHLTIIHKYTPVLFDTSHWVRVIDLTDLSLPTCFIHFLEEMYHITNISWYALYWKPPALQQSCDDDSVSSLNDLYKHMLSSSSASFIHTNPMSKMEAVETRNHSPFWPDHPWVQWSNRLVAVPQSSCFCFSLTHTCRLTQTHTRSLSVTTTYSQMETNPK